MRSSTFAIAAATTILGGCAHSEATTTSQSQTESARAAIAAQHEAWREAIIAGNSGALASLFAEDGMLLGLDGSVAKGRAEIERVLRDALRRSKYLSGGFTIEQLDLQGPANPADVDDPDMGQHAGEPERRRGFVFRGLPPLLSHA